MIGKVLCIAALTATTATAAAIAKLMPDSSAAGMRRRFKDNVLMGSVQFHAY